MDRKLTGNNFIEKLVFHKIIWLATFKRCQISKIFGIAFSRLLFKKQNIILWTRTIRSMRIVSGTILVLRMKIRRGKGMLFDEVEYPPVNRILPSEEWGWEYPSFATFLFKKSRMISKILRIHKNEFVIFCFFWKFKRRIFSLCFFLFSKEKEIFKKELDTFWSKLLKLKVLWVWAKPSMIDDEN